MNAHFNYSFDRFLVDPAKRMLWRGEERIPIQPKVFDCLVYLIEHRDRTVGHDELIAAVWGRVDLSDHVVVNTIGRARQAVGDTGEEQRIIRTLARVGYSWVLPVDEVRNEVSGNGLGSGQAHANGDSPEQQPPTCDDQASVQGTSIRVESDSEPRRAETRLADIHAASPTLVNATNPARSQPVVDSVPATRRYRTRFTNRHRAVLAVLVLVLLTAAVWGVILKNAQPPTLLEGEAAIVLPVNVIGDESSNWIRLGVMDLIADRLRAAGQAVVLSENTVALTRSLQDTKKPSPAELEAMAQAATATLVVDAEAERVDNHWRVTLRTVHGRDRQLVAQGDHQDVLAAARNAADRMAQVLGYTPEEVGEAEDGSALGQLLQRMKAAELSSDYQEIQRLFASAAPEHLAVPRVRYHAARAAFRLGHFDEATNSLELLLQDAAVAEDPVLKGQVHNVLGAISLYVNDYPPAERHFSEAVELVENVRSFEARDVLGSVLSVRGGIYVLLGKHDMALSDFSRSRLALESTANQLYLVTLHNNLGFAHRVAHRFAEAVSHSEKAIEGARNFHVPSTELRARFTMLMVHLDMLDPQKALVDLPQLQQLLLQDSSPVINIDVRLGICHALIAAGRLREAELLLNETQDDAQKLETSERLAMARFIAARLAWAKRDYRSALRESEHALSDTSWIEGEPVSVALAYLIHLRASQALGAKVVASDALREAALVLSQNHSIAVDSVVSALVAALEAAAQDRVEDARNFFRKAQQEAESSRAPYLFLEVARDYSQWLIDQGDAAAAAVVAGRVADWADRHYEAALLQLQVHHALGDPIPWRSSLTTVRALAGEREIPSDLLALPASEAVNAEVAITPASSTP